MTVTERPAVWVGHTQKFIEALGRSGDKVHYLGFHPKGSSNKTANKKISSEIPFDDLAEWQESGMGVHVVINRGGSKRSEITDCVAIFYEHDEVTAEQAEHLKGLCDGFEFPFLETRANKKGVETDYCSVPLELQSQLWAALGLPKPTMQVSTGGKSIHNYWVFDEPIDPNQWDELQKDLLIFSCADTSLADRNQAMRLPGFRHSSGQYAKLSGGSGETHRYSDLRKLIPRQKKEQRAEVIRQVTWTEFDRTFRLPWRDHVPIDICLSRTVRDLISSGVTSNRNDTGAMVARELIGTAAQLTGLGQAYDGDPLMLFYSYCHACSSGDGWEEREWDQIWRSAENSNPGSSLDPEKIEACIKAWAWKNCRPEMVVESSAPFRQCDQQEVGDDGTESLEKAVRDLARDSDVWSQIAKRANILRQYKGLSRADLATLEAEAVRIAPKKSLTLSDLGATVLEELQSPPRQNIGAPWGYQDLDDLTSGCGLGSVSVVFARAKTGKSAFMMNCAKRQTRMTKKPVLVFSMESPGEDLYYRMLADEAGVPFNRLKKRSFFGEEQVRIGNAITAMLSDQVIINDTSYLSVAEIEEIILKTRAEHGELAAVWIDQFSWLSRQGTDRAMAFEKNSRDLVALAKRMADKNEGHGMDTSLIVLAQSNRSVTGQNNKRPTDSSLFGSDGPAQDVAILIALYRDEMYNPDSSDRGIMEAIVLSNRNGPTGTARLIYEAEFMRLHDERRY